MSKLDDVVNSVHIASAIIWSRGALSMDEAIAQAFQLRAKIEEASAAAERLVKRDMRKSKVK